MTPPTPISIDFLKKELDEHHQYARQLFTVITTWWAFFCTANAAVILAINAQFRPFDPRIYAWIVFVLDAFAIGFCLITAIRFLQINDRVDVILAHTAGRTKSADPQTVGALIRRVWTKMIELPKPNSNDPQSSVPLSYYLICVVSLMICTGIMAVGWLFTALLIDPTPRMGVLIQTTNPPAATSPK